MSTSSRSQRRNAGVRWRRTWTGDWKLRSKWLEHSGANFWSDNRSDDGSLCPYPGWDYGNVSGESGAVVAAAPWVSFIFRRSLPIETEVGCSGLKSRTRDSYLKFSKQLQVSKKDLIACKDDKLIWQLMMARFDYLRINFLLERLSVERGGGQANKNCLRWRGRRWTCWYSCGWREIGVWIVSMITTS